MESWSNSRLLVLGDTIVDQYAACEAIGMSAEAPVVDVREPARKIYRCLSSRSGSYWL